MRYAIVSDIHANLPAWNAVLLDIRTAGVDRIICLGDIVGYGPCPREVLESVYAAVDHFVLGNHDAALCGLLDPELFTEPAQRVIGWSRERLAPSALRFLKGLPLVLEGSGFRCAHGDFAEPAQFHYVESADDALPSWQTAQDPLLFLGHTHRPGLFLLGASGTPHRIDAQDFMLEEQKRFLVNVGSVGYSRDGDPRASYCIHDTTRAAVYWRRVAFDLDAYRAAVARSGLPDRENHLLATDPGRAAQSVRPVMSFTPPTTAERGARAAVQTQRIEVLQKAVRRWRTTAALLAMLLAAAGAAAGALAFRHSQRTWILPALESSPVAPASSATGDNRIPLPATPPPPGGRASDWTLEIADRYRQQTEWFSRADGLTVLKMSSAAPDEYLRAVSRLISAGPGETFTVEGLFRKGPEFDGHLALVVSVDRPESAGGRIEEFLVKEPNAQRREGWLEAQQTFRTPAGATAVQVAVRGRFTGIAEVRGVSLIRKD